VFGWLDSSKVDALADSVIADLRRLVPVSGAEARTQKDLQKLRKQFGAVFSRIDAFLVSNRLGLYAKARLGNRVKWALKEAGYPAPFIEQVTKEIALHAALVKRQHRAEKR
jgi:hypothetical protein